MFNSGSPRVDLTWDYAAYCIETIAMEHGMCGGFSQERITNALFTDNLYLENTLDAPCIVSQSQLFTFRLDFRE